MKQTIFRKESQNSNTTPADQARRQYGSKELMTKAARNRLSDSIESGYDDDELIAYFNDAIEFIWHALIDNNYYEVIGDYTFYKEKYTR